jgi:branched-subunit amino acid transport protein
MAFVLAALVAWAPWPIRNYARLHAFVPFLTMGGVALYNSHSDQSPDAAWSYMAEHTELGEVGFDRHFTREALLLIRTHPGDAARRLSRATIDYVGPILDRRRLVWLHRFAMLAVLPALVWPEALRRLALPFAIWAAFGALLIPIVVNPRYRFPTEWCVVLGAAFGLSALADRVGVKRAAIAAATALAVCVAFTLAAGRP